MSDPLTLKPCPFCGPSGDGVRAPRLTSRADKALFVCPFVICDTCGAAGPLAMDKIDAIEAWNTRVAAPREHVCHWLPPVAPDTTDVCESCGDERPIGMPREQERSPRGEGENLRDVLTDYIMHRATIHEDLAQVSLTPRVEAIISAADLLAHTLRGSPLVSVPRPESAQPPKDA